LSLHEQQSNKEVDNIKEKLEHKDIKLIDQTNQL